MEAAELLLKAKGATRSFSLWMDEKIEPIAQKAHALELASWRKEFFLIKGLIDRPDRLQIALVGTTGAGKSTFLNAILGQEILPVGVMEPCTAFVTSVRHSVDPGYSVEIQFCTQKEWESDLRSLVSALQPGEGEEDSENRTEGKRLMDAARKRIQAVYGIPVDENTNPAALLDGNLPPEVESIFKRGSSEISKFIDAKSMLAHVRKLIRGESSLWPLVKQVSISGFYPYLAGGLELIDLPGLNDPNEARVEVTRDFLRTSPFVWVVFPMVRGLTEDIRRILQEEKLLRTLVLSGTYGALSLVGTKADEIDIDVASQFGLPEDCSQIELIEAYREQTVMAARKQLEQMVKDLTSGSENGETLARMIDMARQVCVHTTTASAYIKIKKIARRTKDYGVDDEVDTGIPAVHKHLLEISAKVGAGFNAQNALRRLDQLHDEIVFFFRARAQAPTREMEQARLKLQQECSEFCGSIKSVHDTANKQLILCRDQFLKKLDPLFASSVQGVKRAVEGWHGIHWATLRAVVNRDGIYRSPTTGRSFDFNEDLAEPLLEQLPVSWEHYFTDELGRVTDDFVVRVAESTKGYCSRVRLIVELLFNRTDESIEKQLSWFQDKISTLATTAQNEVLAAVRERRMELAANMSIVAKQRMQGAYDAAKNERGPGMKKRILRLLEPVAIESAQPIYSTIRADLLEGLKDLELIIVGMFRNLTLAAEEHAQNVAHNANIDVDQAAMNPVISDILASAPGKYENK